MRVSTALILTALAAPLLGASPLPLNAPPLPMADSRPAPALQPKGCSSEQVFARGMEGSAQMHRLDELPRAETFMAVMRVDQRGCIDPMLASERFSAPRKRAP